MPKQMSVQIQGWPVTIHNHRVTSKDGLFGRIAVIVRYPDSYRESLAEFEKYGINFEMVVEYCACELLDDPLILAGVTWHYNIKTFKHTPSTILWNRITMFSKSIVGRHIADQFIDKIRNCDNWGELYDIMHPQNKFNRNIRSRMTAELTCH